jgi:hypothetical protein
MNIFMKLNKFYPALNSKVTVASVHAPLSSCEVEGGLSAIRSSYETICDSLRKTQKNT